MKLQHFFLCMIFLLFSATVFAQRAKVNVKGQVVEEGTDIPVEQATVRLLSVKDSILVGGVVSEKNGSFVLKNIRPGSYLLHITFVGFNHLYQPLTITGKKNPVEVGKLELSDGAIELGEAVVLGKAPEVTVRNDTVEYNADSYKVTEGSMLEDLLKKMPGVEVSSDGKITVNGKEIKKIMVDGKEFFTNDPKVASKNLPAQMVDKIQVYDRKSDMTMMTGFDDGDEEATINLTVKSGMKQGWFGNAFAGYGSKDRYEANAMVNRFINNDQLTFMGGLNNTNNMGFTDLASAMFSGMGGGGRRMLGGFGAGNGITSSGNAGLNFSKEFSSTFTWSGNTRYSHSDNDAQSNVRKESFVSQDSTLLEYSKNKSNPVSDNIGTEFRLEWKPDTLTNIIFRPEFEYSRSSGFSDELTDVMNNATDTIRRVSSQTNSDGQGYDVSGRLEFSRKLNSKGRVFSASLSGGLSDSYTDEDYYYKQESNSAKDSILDQRIRYDNSGYNYRVFTSWVEPLGRNNFLQLTYSFSQRQQESLKNSYNKDLEGNEYTQLDTTYSKNFRNDFISQRIGISFKAQRQKYNYTIGFNVDPSYSKSENFIGDSVFSNFSRNVINVSPTAQFNYMFSKQSNLRVWYNGRTSQPSMTQLQPVPDISDPLNTVIGNPDLKPTYRNNLSVRFHNFEPEKQTAFMVMANTNYVINDIVSSTVYSQDEAGKRETTYKNVDGNYNANIRAIINTPLKNKKFSINSMTFASFLNNNGFSNGEKNRNRQLSLSENAGIDFRSDLMDLGVNGSISYSKTDNSLQTQNNLETFNYRVGGTTTLYLPYNFKIESDVNYSTNSGYASGYDQEELLWNAALSKTFLKGNQGTLRLKIYDILQDRSNISYSANATATTYSEYNTLNSYFMVHFIYRFSIFKGGASADDARRGPGPGGRRGFGGPPPGRRF
ncbi:MAG: TonB-dependent receptor [Massilibacteroides sp.]|nr:TonB-dependent receptor [Massilibacteroides sp.]MDD3062089.1 TonB-dependent receptor [Massilibacteroides sp.]MDD4114087.1 TonB-dependent receptor [Massilibacteroides sp.]MDD4659633.1 TonB-dependent receptor [Massilibacteroides sp.]